MSSTSPEREPEPLSFGGYSKTSKSLEGVGFWPRFVARMIDTLAHFFIALVTGFAFGVAVVFVAVASGEPYEPFLNRLGATTLSAFVLALAGAVAYHTMCEGISGASLGKRILGIIVVKDDGGHCTMGPALVRSLAYFVDGLFFGVVGYMSMRRTASQQRNGDVWARTVVVNRKKLTPERLRAGVGFLRGCFSGLC